MQMHTESIFKQGRVGESGKDGAQQLKQGIVALGASMRGHPQAMRQILHLLINPGQLDQPFLMQLRYRSL